MEPPPSSGPSFPTLEHLDPSTPHTFVTPAKRINEGDDVTHFLTSKAYRDIGIFVMQLNRAMCPRRTGGQGRDGVQTFMLGSRSETEPVESVRKLQLLLQKAESLIDEAPPDPGPRRFGNVSFRKWYGLLEERVPGLLKEYVADDVLSFGGAVTGSDRGKAADELVSYLLGGFGSSQRLDYGTGHELSFVAFLGCLWKLGAFRDGAKDGEIEREIVLGVLEPYLRVVRKLILTYTLEPAGSHGVWGLDDHSFMPYIFGSAQLTRPINENETMPLEGSVAGAPKPAQVVKADVVERERTRNMYFSAVGFINDVKKGPFWEHSPILFDISGVRDGWGKINKGMIKMFNAEVLSKFPVVQHFPFGSLFSWDQDPNAAAPKQSIHMANQPIAAAATAGTTAPPPPTGGAGTAAPWAQGTRAPPPPGTGIPYSNSRAPWAAGQPTARPPPPGGPASSAGGSTAAQITVTKAPWAKPDTGSGG